MQRVNNSRINEVKSDRVITIWIIIKKIYKFEII